MADKVDLFDLYFQYVAGTEPPAVFHRWSLIGCIGAILGHQCWFPFGSSRIFPNKYIMFVGDPGTRKSTAIKKAVKLIRMAGFDHFGAQKSSQEKFLMDLELDNMENDEIIGGVNYNGNAPSKKDSIDILANLNLRLEGDNDGDIPREMFIAADEFNNFLGPGNLSFQSLLGELWDWDEPANHYKQRLKNSKSVRIYQPTINILAGNTPSSFADCFPLASIGQGFMSRLILIHSEPSGIKVTVPAVPDETLTLRIIKHMQTMRQVCIGPIAIDAEAYSALDLIYKSWPDIDDARFRHYSSRRLTHLIKLLIIVTTARLSTTISILDIIQANTVLSYAETTMPKAIGELGKSKNAEAANKIMQVLYNAREFKTIQELYKVVTNDIGGMIELSGLMMNLEQADKVFTGKNATGKMGYLPRQKALNRQLPFTNFLLLQGKEYK